MVSITKPHQAKSWRKPNHRGQSAVMRTAVGCHDRARYKFAAINEIVIPREVLDNLEISSGEKLIYGLIYKYRTWVTLTKHDIAGLCGLSPHSVENQMKRLVNMGFIRKNKIYKTTKYGPRPMCRYKVVVPPKRVFNKTNAMICNDITDIDNDFERYFHEIKLDR